MHAKTHIVNGRRVYLFDGPPKEKTPQESIPEAVPDPPKQRASSPPVHEYIPEPKPGLCQGCERLYSSLTRHHIRPRAQGGDNSRANIMWLCVRCHDFVEEQLPLPLTREGIKNACSDFILTKSDKDVLCKKHGRWQTWVYGGAKASDVCNCDVKPEIKPRARRKVYADRQSGMPDALREQPTPLTINQDLGLANG